MSEYDMEYPEAYVKMEPKKIGKIVGKFIKTCVGGDPLCPCQDGDACHYEGENPMKQLDLVHEMCELIKKMNAISERMNHFEAWFANVGDRIGTMEKRLDGYEQKLQIWINGRGGMS